MTLGMIAEISEASFERAAGLGLDFIEFCINGGNSGEALFDNLRNIRGWIQKYRVSVGSIGRWKAEILTPEGEIAPEEEALAVRLMEAAAELGCPSYVCGCNPAEGLSLETNLDRATAFMSGLLEKKPDSVRLSVYNCRKMNFIHGPETWSRLFAELPELGLKYDPSHALREGKDYLAELSDWGDRVYHVHLKGTLMAGGEVVDDPPAGLDQTDWKSVLAILYARGYDGGLSLEPHSPIWRGRLGEFGLKYSVNYFSALLAERPGAQK